MQRRSSTLQIKNAIKNNQLILEKAEVYNKTTRKTEEITNEKFLESFYYFCESGIFTDSIGWDFQKNCKTGIYEVEAGRLDGGVDIVITAYFRKGDDVTDEMVKDALLKIEEE